MSRRTLLLLALFPPGCGDDSAAQSRTGGSGGAGTFVDSAVVDTSIPDSSILDGGVLDTSAADASVVDCDLDAWGGSGSDDAKPTIAILADDILGGPTGPDASDPWPIRFTFDTGIESAEVVPGGETRPREALLHNAEDAQGTPSSGSLEVQRRFPACDNHAGSSATVVRLFSVDAGDARDWRGYRIAGRFKVGDGSAHCSSNAGFYVQTGADRTFYLSDVKWLTTSEWRSVVFDVPFISTTADLSQIVEFGLWFDRDLCIPN